MYTFLHAYILFELPLLQNNFACENIFTQIGSRAKRSLDIYGLGEGLVVTGRKRDIGQNVL
jgi:hypothetical protein